MECEVDIDCGHVRQSRAFNSLLRENDDCRYAQVPIPLVSHLAIQKDEHYQLFMSFSSQIKWGRAVPLNLAGTVPRFRQAV